MKIDNFVAITRKYKKCPKCGASWKTTSLQCSLENEVIHITCTCGFSKYVDENNAEVPHVQS